MEVETVIDDDTKFGIKMSIFIFLLAGAVVVFIAWLGCLFSENEVQPPPVEAPATTAREEIVTGVYTFGGCPVATTACITACTTASTVYELEKVEEAVEHVRDIYTLTEPVTERHDNGYIGTMWITGYTAEEGFPEGSDTASGYGVRPGFCAMNAEQRRSLGISYGDQICVEGLGTYMVMDSGCDWGVVDIWVYSNAEAYAITGNYDVYLI